MTAILFGSLSTIADTSELQRDAFNRAFEANGLDWRWDRDEYLKLLEQSGGAKRIAEYAETRGEAVDADDIHRSKSEIFQASLADSGLKPRSGVVDTINESRESGYKVALVTTTSKENVSGLIEALSPDLEASDFDLIVDSTSVDVPKPDAAAYDFALRELEERADDCVAIEDNLGGVEAAGSAGVNCVAFPNENTAAHDFAQAERSVDRLDFSELRTLIPNA